MTLPDRTPSDVRRVMLASFVGTAIEWYDFFIYGTAAALVFGLNRRWLAGVLVVAALLYPSDSNQLGISARVVSTDRKKRNQLSMPVDVMIPMSGLTFSSDDKGLAADISIFIAITCGILCVFTCGRSRDTSPAATISSSKIRRAECCSSSTCRTTWSHTQSRSATTSTPGPPRTCARLRSRRAGTPPAARGFRRIRRGRCRGSCRGSGRASWWRRHRAGGTRCGDGGCGLRMLRTLLDPLPVRLRRWVLATRDAHGLYEQFEFAPLRFPERWMEKTAPNAY